MSDPQYKELHQLAERFGTPFYLLDGDKFMANYHGIQAAFRSRYAKSVVAYSYKANYIPYLCHLVKNAGGYAEVVSRLEYDLALRVGQDAEKIIFNGPIKEYADIELALKNRSLINLESWYEIDHLAAYAKKHPTATIEVGLRINVDLRDAHGVSTLQGGLDSSRFGFAVKPDGISRALELIVGMTNVSVICLSAHCSSSNRALWVYERIARTLCEVAAQANLDTVRYIDVGGGIFGKVPKQMQWIETPTFDEYAETICSVLSSYPWVKKRQPILVLEPGIAMAANCMSLVARVMDIKSINGINYILVDGSVFNVKPSLHKHNLPYTFHAEQPRSDQQKYMVCGNTCMEKDVLLEDIVTNEVRRGDYLRIDNVGAYSVVMSPPFITTFPPIIAQVDGVDTVLRKRQDFKSFFGDYRFF